MHEKVPAKPLSWRDALLIPIGFGERETSPRSMKWPKELVKRIDAIADETHQDWTTTVMHLVRWALDEYDRQRAAEKKEKRGA